MLAGAIIIAMVFSIYTHNLYKKGRSISFTYMGMAVKKKGDCVKAIEYFSMAIEANPKDHVAYILLGDCYLKLNREDLAMEEYKISYSLIEKSSDIVHIYDRKVLEKKIQNLRNKQSGQ